MPSEKVVVSGKIVFDGVAKPFANATVYVRLEDVSKMDVPSQTLAEQVIGNVGVAEDEWRAGVVREVEFSLAAEISDLRGMYVVQVHVDVDGDGRVGVGDFITQEYYPVVTQGNPRFVVVHVKEVK